MGVWLTARRRLLPRGLGTLPLAAALFCGASCDAAGPAPRRTASSSEAPPPSTSPSSSPVVDASTPCDRLSRLQCFKSDHCTLHWLADRKYECRPDTGPCETGLRQSDHAACKAKEGCAWEPGECWCPYPGYGKTLVDDPVDRHGAGACACGGGRPPSCAAKK